MKLVALGYKARHGKDALAQILSDDHGYHIIRFSDALYEACRILVVDIYDGGMIKINGYPMPDDACLHDKISAWGRWSRSCRQDLWTRREDVYTYWGMLDKDPLLLQWYGTDYIRKHVGHEYWIGKVEERLEELEFAPTVIPDVRFQNEARFAKQHGALLVHVTRAVPLESTGRDDAHESETAMDGYTGWDMTVNNDGTLDDLRREAGIIAAIMKGRESQ